MYVSICVYLYMCVSMYVYRAEADAWAKASIEEDDMDDGGDD